MTPTYHLLVADDDDGLRESIAMALESQGYWVSPAGSGEEALAIAKSHLIDCAILDYRMGDMTGLELLRQLRATSALRASILLTAELERTLQTQAHLAGIGACLKKPVTPDQLRSTVAQVLRQYGGGADPR